MSTYLRKQWTRKINTLRDHIRKKYPVHVMFNYNIYHKQNEKTEKEIIRLTISFIEIVPNNIYARGISITSPKDNYCRAVGNYISMKRAFDAFCKYKEEGIEDYKGELIKRNDIKYLLEKFCRLMPSNIRAVDDFMFKSRILTQLTKDEIKYYNCKCRQRTKKKVEKELSYLNYFKGDEDSPIDSDDFYELMQTYRHCPKGDQTRTIECFQDIKNWINKYYEPKK